MEDSLQASWKNALEVTKEVTRLQNLHMKDSADFGIRKDIFERELTELKKNVSHKSWVLTVKINSLVTELKAMKEKIQLLEGSSPWSSHKVWYEWN